MHGWGVSLDGVRVGVRHPSEAAEVAGLQGAGEGEERKGPSVVGAAPSSLPCRPAASPAAPDESRKREESGGGQADGQGLRWGADAWARSVGCGNGKCSAHRCHCRGNCNGRRIG